MPVVDIPASRLALTDVLVVGAGGGIGSALATALLRRPGLRTLYASSRRPSAASRLQAQATTDARLRPLTLDVTDEASVAAAAAKVVATSPRLQLLVNCAGLLHDDQLRPERRLADVDAAALARSFAVNASGALLLAKHFQPLLTHAAPAVLANLSARVGSISDNRLGGWYAYRAAKAAQNQITRTLSIELARRAPQLVCVALHPGTVDTALSAPFQAGVKPEKLFTPEFAAERLLAVIDALTPAETGRFYAWDGSEIPW